MTLVFSQKYNSFDLPFIQGWSLIGTNMVPKISAGGGWGGLRY